MFKTTQVCLLKNQSNEWAFGERQDDLLFNERKFFLSGHFLSDLLNGNTRNIT